ncbi:ubiquitin-conjugating enzyme E2 J2-like isoform X1 [Prunus yedoensis var. nudiflora]|uniref:Ubiquitin-conjugating enzyme E2 J2-like isoform X1 n=1 Tax=Prunus yedoensis var. nudiflora TaxID=2094558 RepID=A0A314XHY9_PRUYE|nr:ubiquitin-conjugating enzyme E2 J2-like isoform X1 [Prunus yedoensis var. nudiflora]
MELDRYPAMKRIREEYSEIESKPSDVRVGSTQIEQNQMELHRYPGMKRIRKIKSKPSDDRFGLTQIIESILERVRRRLAEEYRAIKSNPSDDFDCRMLERNPYEWQFGIRGASGTEFEGGVYHGRIQFPEEYPSKPPSFTLLTENGRFKTHNKIRIRRLNDWLPSWTVRDALYALIDEMPTYPDGELGSVEYNKEETRDLAIKSRAAAPKFGTSERQKLIDEIHKYLLSKSPPVPVPQLSPSQASNGRGGGYVVNVSGNIFHATNSNGVGILGSMNEFSDEGHKPKKVKLSWPKRRLCRQR